MVDEDWARDEQEKEKRSGKGKGKVLAAVIVVVIVVAFAIFFATRSGPPTAQVIKEPEESLEIEEGGEIGEIGEVGEVGVVEKVLRASPLELIPNKENFEEWIFSENQTFLTDIAYSGYEAGVRQAMCKNIEEEKCKITWIGVPSDASKVTFTVLRFGNVEQAKGYASFKTDEVEREEEIFPIVISTEGCYSYEGTGIGLNSICRKNNFVYLLRVEVGSIAKENPEWLLSSTASLIYQKIEKAE